MLDVRLARYPFFEFSFVSDENATIGYPPGMRPVEPDTRRLRKKRTTILEDRAATSATSASRASHPLRSLLESRVHAGSEGHDPFRVGSRPASADGTLSPVTRLSDAESCPVCDRSADPTRLHFSGYIRAIEAQLNRRTGISAGTRVVNHDV